LKSYNVKYEKYLHKFRITETITRITKLTMVTALLIHLFTCFYYLTAKLNELAPNTWVYNEEIYKYPEHMQYGITLYWACQTITTVGFGDYNTKFHTNNSEIIVKIIWMTISIFMYCIFLGTFMSIIKKKNKD